MCGDSAQYLTACKVFLLQVPGNLMIATPAPCPLRHGERQTGKDGLEWPPQESQGPQPSLHVETITARIPAPPSLWQILSLNCRREWGRGGLRSRESQPLTSLLRQHRPQRSSLPTPCLSGGGGGRGGLKRKCEVGGPRIGGRMRTAASRMVRPRLTGNAELGASGDI